MGYPVKPLIAVFGTGSAGMHHLNALRGIGSVRPLAVPLRKRRLGELKSSGFETAEDLRQAASRGTHACIIATETGRHVADALAAVNLGMNLLIEKPLGTAAAETRRLISAVSRKRRKAYVACVLRFSDSLNRFRELLRGIGALHSVRVECRSYLPDWRPQRPYRETYSARSRDGGVLRELIHEIDYAGWLFGWPKTVYGRLGNTGRLKISSEEWAELLWDGRSGSVSVGLDYLTRATRRGMLACGEKGTLEWNAVAQTVTWTPANKTPTRSSMIQSREGPYISQMRAFIGALNGHTDHCLVSLQDGFRALAVCDAGRLSAKTHRREAVHTL